MIYLFEDRMGGVSQVFDPIGLSQEQIDRAIKVESLPEKQEIEGKVAELKIVDKQPVWEYKDKPRDTSDEVQELKQRIKTLENLLVEKQVLSAVEIGKAEEEVRK